MNQTDTGDDNINLGMLLLLDVSDQTHREAYGIKELPGNRQLFYLSRQRAEARLRTLFS
ncbi:hypothetical protein [[Clostridium] aminophilum]|uniref:hypothetical protein n=1 Tax=[Clostridium] aminophilum TaxID=1526 RepID=UPI0012B57902|nr:hypothetical protein [[Clostridium] aminophilum]